MKTHDLVIDSLITNKYSVKTEISQYMTKNNRRLEQNI